MSTDGVEREQAAVIFAAWFPEGPPPGLDVDAIVENLAVVLRAVRAPLQADLAALLRYVDEAKIEAQHLGRVSGEPLLDFLRRLRAELGR